MEYSSFYGGRKGSSFVLKKEYPTIASTAQNDTTSMIADFKSTTCQVNFGEYVIINNPNRLHPDQGKVFKRDYDVNSNRTIIYHVQGNGSDWTEAETLAYGAQEVGTITGAPGAAPHLYVENYEEVVPRLEGEQGREIKSSEGIFSSTFVNQEDTEINERTLIFTNNDADTTTYINYISTNHKVPTFITVGSSLVYLRDLVDDDSFDGIDLIPGKYVLKYKIGQGEQQQITVYNDDIQYISVSSRSDTNNETDSYIGFKFPYHTFATTSTWVQPYQNEIYADTTKVENIDNPKHPLSSTLKFSIPKGIQGNTPEDLKVITIYKNENNGDVSFSLDGDQIHLWKQDDNDQFEINTTTNLPSELDSVENPFDIYVYKVRTFEDKQAGELVTDQSQNIKYYYLGLVSLIKNISYNDGTGQISAIKTDGTTAVINELTPIKYVKSVELLQTPENPDSDNDYQYKIQFKDNTNDDVGNPIDLDAVEALSYNDLTGGITTTSKSGKEELINENTLIEYVKDVEFLQTPANPGPDDYQYKIQFKANTGTEIQPDEGESYIEYNDIGQEIDLDTVDTLSYDDSTGLVTATYKSTKQEYINENAPIEYINEVSVSTPDDDLFQSITFTYNTNTEEDPVTATFPLRQVIRTDNLKLNEISNVSNFSSEDLGETLYQNMSGLIGVEMNLIKKTPVANLNTFIINQLQALGNNYENNVTKIRYLGLLLKSETQNPKSNYIRYSYQTSEGDQLNIYAEGTNEIARIVTDTQDANNPRVLILNSSLKIRFERILNGYYDTFDDDYGWIEAFKLTTFEKRNVDIKYDITEEFMAEVAAAASDSQSDFYNAQPYQTEKVVKYLNQTYPLHKESNSQLSDIVTILIGYNQWRVATSEDVLDEVVTIADVSGDNVFVPTGDVINNSQQILSEPKTAFYAYNEAILERTGTLTSAQQTTYNGYADKSSRDNLVALFNDPLLISADINSDNYSYTYQAKGGWYALSNLFSTTIENSSGGDGASIVFSSNPNTSIANADVDTILVYYTEE